jgi:hypothetical protein
MTDRIDPRAAITACRGRFMAAFATGDRDAASIELTTMAGYLDLAARGELADRVREELTDLTELYRDESAWI